MNVQVRPLEGGIGAEVLGLDLSLPIEPSIAKTLEMAWLEAGILVFRGLGTDAEGQLRLSRCFGELEIHPIESLRLPGNPEIILLAQKGDHQQMTYSFDGESIVGRIPFHADLVYTPTPNRGALLRAIETPRIGGETAWIDTAAAYDALDDAIKERIEKIEARFEFVKDIRELRFGREGRIELESFGSFEFPEFPPVAHPLVWTHPVSGRKSLALSTVHLIEVVGMDRAEGDALLDALVDHTLDGRFTYTHAWQPDDMVLWDNWRTLHSARGTPPGCDRVMHRTTIRGDVATGRLL